MPKTTSMTVSLAARVRQVRLLRGLTQSEVAGRAGLSRATYQRFERAGVLGLDGFVRVLECLGLAHQLAAVGTDDAAAIAQGYTSRQRGRRRARAAVTEPTRKPTDPAPAAEPTPAAGAPTEGGVPVASDTAVADCAATSANSEAIKRAASEHRDTITALVRCIVFNRLTNHTAGPVVRTMLRGERGLDEATKPAVVAALESELRQLNAENIAEHSIGLHDFLAWQPTWKADQGIAHALD